MRSKTVLAVSALFAVVLAAAVLGPSSDVSDAASQRWESSDCSGMSVEYTDGNTYLVIVLDSDPGLGMYDVIVGGKVLKASGSDGKRVGVEMGVALDKTQNYTVIATPNGATYHCTLSYLQFYDVAATVDPSAGGSVSGAKEYKAGEQVTVTAEAAAGYLFDGWFAGSERVSTQAEYTFSASADVTLTAKFINAMSTISFDSNGGSAVDSITQAYGTAVTAPADPSKDGFTFVRWDQEIPSTVPAKNLTISAVWAAMNVTVDGTGKADVVLDKDTDAFVLPADAKSVTVTVDDNISVVIQDTSALGTGTTVIAKVEEIPNTAEVDGTVRAYEVTVTKADDQPITGKMQVTLPYTPEKGKVPAVYWQNGSALEKMRVISHTSDSVTFETTHNSTYVVVAESASEDSGATFMLYFGLLVVVGIALSMIVGFNYYRRKA